MDEPPRRAALPVTAGASLSRSHSFRITLSNNKTEKEGVEYLRRADPRFVLLDRPSRQLLMMEMDIPRTFSRAFDLIYVRRPPRSTSLVLRTAESVDVIEVKTTKARLPNFPTGFFFGATKNEFDLAERLGRQFKFCLVCLHPETAGFVLLTVPELEQRIRTKRIQFQINL